MCVCACVCVCVQLIEMRLGMRLKQRVMKAHALEQGNAEDEHEQEVDTYALIPSHTSLGDT